MKEQLIHILDQSVCLSRKQMKEYLGGAMLPEEVHAAELHLISCALCSLAMEGFEEHSEQALAAISALNSGFLKDHFDNISPQIHLNSIAHTAALPAAARRPVLLLPMWRRVSIAAAALLLFGLVWAFQHNRRMEVVPVRDIAMNSGEPAGTAAASTPVERSVNGAAPVEAAPKPEAPVATSAAPAVKATTAQDLKTGKPTQHPKTETLLAAKKATQESKTPSAIASADNTAANQPDETPARSRSTTEPAPAKDKTAAAPVAEAKDDIEHGDESYGKGSYGAALAHYKKGMASTDPHTRYQSMIMAAQCYAALGNKAKAEQLLQRVIDEGSGPERRSAKRALRRMN